MEQDQKPEEVQSSFKVYVNRVEDGQNDIYQPQEADQEELLVLTSNAGRDKAEVQKDPNVSPQL